ncbi:MAG: DUF6503 family protein [Nonlabens sp.]|uniref:DUF6503 family protein n=1 Tax=Nonlabens sp. TaxID=1888209 RepID=UPI003EFA7BD3
MKHLQYIFLCAITIVLHSCNIPAQISAEDIINKSIKAHGADLLENSTMEFNFRNVAYQAVRENGNFEYSRTRVTDTTTTTDILANDKKERFINQVQQQVPDSLLNRYASSVNSVIYFAQLPYSLDGNAVYKELIGERSIKNQEYYKIKVTFDPDGGGEDHEDEFIYWINQENFLVDYLAYSYCEEDCGYRFRESVNRRTIKGVTVQDYNNYKETVQDPELSQMDVFYMAGDLELLSEIKLEDVRITGKAFN